MEQGSGDDCALADRHPGVVVVAEVVPKPAELLGRDLFNNEQLTPAQLADQLDAERERPSPRPDGLY